MPNYDLEFEPHFVRKSGDGETLMTDEGSPSFRKKTFLQPVVARVDLLQASGLS